MDTDGHRQTSPSAACSWFLTASSVVVGLVLLGGAVVAAQGRLIGGDDGADCVTDQAAVGAASAEGTGVSITPSYWPLGTDCTLSGPDGSTVTVPEDDWTLTAVAVTGAALVVAPGVALPLSRRRSSRPAAR